MFPPREPAARLSTESEPALSPPHLSPVLRPAGVAPGPGYSQVVRGRGDLVVVSGQVALDEHGQVVGVGEPNAQARQIYANLDRCLRAVGASFGDVLRFTWYVTDVAYLPALREARDLYVDRAAPPGCSAVQVAGLVRPEFLMEVDAIALVVGAES